MQRALHMNNSIKSDFNKFICSKTLSSFGDEVWLFAIPLFLASTKLVDADSFGYVVSLGFAGELLGIFLSFVFLQKAISSKLASICDLISILSLFVMGLMLSNVITFSIFAFFSIYFVMAISSSIWFSSTEVLVTKLFKGVSSQSAHKMNYFSRTLGPTIAPAMSGSILSIVGILPIVAFNIFSFFFQLITLKKFIKVEPVNKKNMRKIKSFFSASFSYKSIAYYTITPMIVKFFLVSFLPFIGFYLVKNGTSIINTGILMTIFTVSSVIGVILYKEKSFDSLLNSFIFSVPLVLLSTLIVFLGIFIFENNLVLCIGLFLSGIFSSFYTIELRSLTSYVVSDDDLEHTLPSVSFYARIIQPIAALFYGYIIYTDAFSVIISLNILMIILAIYFVYKLTDAIKKTEYREVT